jgi:hypothetical protein
MRSRLLFWTWHSPRGGWETTDQLRTTTAPNSAHINGQPWTPASSGSRSTTVLAGSGDQGVASSNLASPTSELLCQWHIGRSRQLVRIGPHRLMCEQCASNQVSGAVRRPLTDRRDHVRVDIRCDRDGAVAADLGHGADVGTASDHEAGCRMPQAVDCHLRQRRTGGGRQRWIKAADLRLASLRPASSSQP